MYKLSHVSYSIKVSLNCVKTNFKQKLMFITAKPSQRRGAVPPDPRIQDLLSGTGTPPEKFLPTPLGCHTEKFKIQAIGASFFRDLAKPLVELGSIKILSDKAIERAN